MSTPAPRRIRMDISALKISRDYRLLFSAEVVTQLGNKMTYVALPFQMKVLTDSYLWVGAVGLAEVIPLIIFGLYGGVLADAFDRRKIIVYAEIVSLIISVALLVYSLFSDQSPIVILVLAAFIAASGGLQSPAMESILPQVVPYQKLPSAMALNSSKNQSTAVVGPMIAGIILASGGVSYAYFIDVLSFFISISLFLKVKAMKPAHNAERPSLKRIKEGLQYAYSRKDLMGTYLIDISAMFFAFPYALFPFVADKLGGVWTLGFLYASIPLGALLAAITSGWSNQVSRYGRTISLSVMGWGVGIVLFGMSHVLIFAMLGLIVAGFFDQLSAIFRSLMWNQSIPDELRGRLASIELLSYSVGPQVGQMRGAIFARAGGLEFSIISGGLLTIFVSIFLSATLKDFYKFDVKTNIFAKKVKDFREKNSNLDPYM